jgi:hypothetical protein
MKNEFKRITKRKTKKEMKYKVDQIKLAGIAFINSTIYN